MGTFIVTDDDIRADFQAAGDDLINEWGKVCRLYYPPRQVQCPNCVYDPIGKKSSNHWLDGGPSFFPLGSMCPMCEGAGTHSEQATEDVKLLCVWSPKDFFVPGPRNIVVPEGRIQTKGFMTDLPKVLQCTEMVVQANLEQMLRARFRRAGEPVDPSSICQGRYFVTNWDRAG
ncbi:MAG: hypothetical protein K2R98_19545 [Gemmataceae bacterium]|nr:hypothetical protein [Gemmataceae bacterium]